MAWKVGAIVSVRREFVELAMVEGANVAELCRRLGVSRKTDEQVAKAPRCWRIALFGVGSEPARFERNRPNVLWHREFKGLFVLGDGSFGICSQCGKCGSARNTECLVNAKNGGR